MAIYTIFFTPSKYLFYFMVTVDLGDLSRATAVPSVRKSDIQAIAFPLAPLNEQTRIVAEIEKQFSRLDEAVANLKRVKANLKRYKAAVLKAAVEGKLTEEWRKQHPDVEPADKLLERILDERRKAAGKGKYKEPVGPDTSGLPELPVGWVWASLDQIASDSLIGLDRGRDQQNADGVGVPYVKMNNVTMDGRVLFDDLVYVEASSDEKFRFSLVNGDVLFNTRNSKELVGKVGLVRQLSVDAIYNNNLMRIRFSNGIVSSFACSQMCSDGFRKRMGLVKKATTNVAAVYAKDLFPLQIALPPEAEQHQIVAEVERRLSIVAGAEAQVDANLRRADRLRQAILKQAFSGQLVPQGPNDEPASVLLERLRAKQPALTKEPAAHQRKHRTPSPKTGAPPPEPLPLVAEASATYGDAIIARILATMQPGHEYARADLVELLGLTAGQWNAAIQELKRVGKVRQVGEKRGAKYLL